MYRSSHFVDEVAWAACWLYMATNDTQYLTDAETKYPDVITEIPWALSWDDKKIGVEVGFEIQGGFTVVIVTQ